MQPSPRRLLLFIIILAVLIGIIQIGAISIAFDKLGLSPESAYLLLLCTLVGSLINLPLFSLKADPGAPPRIPPQLTRLPFFRLPIFPGRITVAINAGGGLVPVTFSLYLITHNPLNPLHVAAAVATVALVTRKFSLPIPGLGIAIPMLVAPVTAALAGAMLDTEQRAPLAYIGGTLGVLIGADLMRLNDIRRLGSPFASIGGAGTLDGVFITGIVAVLLA